MESSTGRGVRSRGTQALPDEGKQPPLPLDLHPRTEPVTSEGNRVADRFGCGPEEVLVHELVPIRWRVSPGNHNPKRRVWVV